MFDSAKFSSDLRKFHAFICDRLKVGGNVRVDAAQQEGVLVHICLTTNALKEEFTMPLGIKSANSPQASNQNFSDGGHGSKNLHF